MGPEGPQLARTRELAGTVSFQRTLRRVASTNGSGTLELATFRLPGNLLTLLTRRSNQLSYRRRN